jgi:hypothetical protein
MIAIRGVFPGLDRAAPGALKSRSSHTGLPFLTQFEEGRQ